MTSILFKKLLKRRCSAIVEGESVFEIVASKLEVARVRSAHEHVVVTTQSHFRFTLLQQIYHRCRLFSSLCDGIDYEFAGQASGSREVKDVFKESLHEQSGEIIVDDEASLFLKGTSNSDHSNDVLSWWRRSAVRYSNIASVVRDVLAVQSALVASESRLSWVEHMINSQRSSLEDETVFACTCTRSWQHVRGG